MRDTMTEGVYGVNRLTGGAKGWKILLPTDKTREKITDKRQKITEIYRQLAKVENFNRQPTK